MQTLHLSECGHKAVVSDWMPGSILRYEYEISQRERELPKDVLIRILLNRPPKGEVVYPRSPLSAAFDTREVPGNWHF